MSMSTFVCLMEKEAFIYYKPQLFCFTYSMSKPKIDQGKVWINNAF